MKRIVFGIILSSLILSFIGCLTESAAKPASIDKRLHELFLQLRMSSLDGYDTFPNSFELLIERSEASGVHIPNAMFLVPDSAHKPGDTKEVSNWTDFIYLGGRTVERPFWDTPLILRPENRSNGLSAYVLDRSGRVRPITQEKLHSFIRNPWQEEKNFEEYGGRMEREQVTLNVPPAFRNEYERDIKESGLRVNP